MPIHLSCGAKEIVQQKNVSILSLFTRDTQILTFLLTPIKLTIIFMVQLIIDKQPDNKTLFIKIVTLKNCITVSD